MTTQCVVLIGRHTARSENADLIRLLDFYSLQSQEVTASGTSGATTIAATHAGSVAQVVNNGSTMVWAHVAATPTAAVGTTVPVRGGSEAWLAGLRAGDKIALIEDS